MLNQKSSSRIGRLNKNTQQVAIKQLINEDVFTKDFNRKIKKQEGHGIPKTVRLKKDIKREELIMNLENQGNITRVLSKLKQKYVKPSSFDKEQVLGLHLPREPSIEDYAINGLNEI